MRILILLAFCLCSLVAHAQEPLSYFLPSATYRAQVPTPEQFLGWQVGQRHVSHDLLLAYMRALAVAAPDRITIKEYARTHELRPLQVLTITSPANHQRLEQIRIDHLALTDPSRSAAADLSKMPAVVYLGYSVHGNEASGSNASLLVAYHLAAAEVAEIEQILANTVILLDPCFNPDGVNRFASWVNSLRSSNPNGSPLDAEHNEAWPGSRTNHYWFDLNRDWMPVQHPESQGRIALFHQWKPDVLTDHHEQGTGATFFFQPGIPSGNNPLTPASVFKLTDKMAAYHAKALDRIGSLYFTREAYDDYYIGKGSSYPDINGGIGILFEQASARGHLADSPNGPLSLAFAVRNHATTSFSTLAAVQALRTELLEHKRTFFKEGLEAGRADAEGHYLFGSEHSPDQAAALAEQLRRHDLRVVPIRQRISAGGKTFEAGHSYAVPLAQPGYRFIKSLFSRPQSFTDSIFYDISAWTLPLAYGLDFATTSTLGDQTAAVAPIAAGADAATAPYAYLLDWSSLGAPRALNALLKGEWIVKVATRPFSLAGKEYEAGTLILPAQHQPKVNTAAGIAELDAIGRACSVRFEALSTGLTDGTNLGSSSFIRVETQSTALVVGAGVNANDAGELWFTLDTRVGLPLTLLPRESLISSLNEFQTIILADGNYPDLRDNERATLRDWVAKGNTLVAYAAAAKWLADNKIVPLRFATAPRDSNSKVQRSYASLSRTQSSQRVPGTILQTTGDLTHPLLFGYADKSIAVFREHNLIMERSRNPFANPLLYAPKPLLAGYLPRGFEGKVAPSASIAVSTVGRGRVIAAMDNPVFRGFWRGTEKLLLNAVFFGQIISPASGQGEEE